MTTATEAFVEHLAIKTELERKTLEELERLTLALQTKYICFMQYAASITTLWNAVAGLVDRDIMDMIAQADKAGQTGLKDGFGSSVFVLTHPEKGVVVLRLEAGGTKVLVINGERKTEMDKGSPKEARAHLIRTRAALQGAGFQVLMSTYS